MARSKSSNANTARRVPPEKQFTTKWYQPAECDLAIKGKLVPQALGDATTQACVVRGIRHHPDYAANLRGTLPIFTRALNARDIMSDIIPEMKTPEEFPYCIWHPVVAKEDTYRVLAQRHPQLRYNVGRACAVGGYRDLLKELDLLPEVNIAAEALDSGFLDIYNEIVQSRVCYTVMNDYDRSMHEQPLIGSRLNDDTATRSLLFMRRKHEAPSGPSQKPLSTRDVYFNITEDYCFDAELEDDISAPVSTSRASIAAKLLYLPLPADLPLCNKDILILAAAYYGDIDRYSRLRRPDMLLQEVTCVVRGICHNTLFAKWWALQPLDPLTQADILRAINARAIMNNDLSRISASIPDLQIPYCIWYPAVPNQSTLRALISLRHDMAHQAARACIVANYEHFFDELDPAPEGPLVAEALASPNPHFMRHFERKLTAAGNSQSLNDVAVHDTPGSEGWKRYTRQHSFEPTSTWLKKEITAYDVGVDFEWLYDGMRADFSRVELFVSFAIGGPTDVVATESGNNGAFDKIHKKLEIEGYVDLSEEYVADDE